MITGLWARVDGDTVLDYPYGPTELRRDLSADVSLPAEISEDWLARDYGIVPVVRAARPLVRPSKVTVEGNPQLVDGVWTQAWVQTDAPAPSKDQLLEYAALKRWEKEIGGVALAGTHIATDRGSQDMIGNAYSYSQAHPNEAIRFKAASGWVLLDAPTLAAIATAVGAHVQACFTAEAELAGDIEAGIVTTYQQVEEAFS